MSSLHVRIKLAQFGLFCKYPEWHENGTYVLGLHVYGEQGTLQWRHGTAVPEVTNVLTRRAVFSLCGRFVRHLPVCGWLHVVPSTIERRASIVTKGWNNKTTDTLLVCMVTETIVRVKNSNPTRGDWCVLEKEINVWVDASSLVIVVLLEKNGAVIEDVCWLQPMNDVSHINLEELNAVLKGINQVL